jgi:hypothetical protein
VREDCNRTVVDSASGLRLRDALSSSAVRDKAFVAR